MDISTQYFDAIALAQPTASPVPTAVLGNITFNITNLLPSVIAVGLPSHTAGVRVLVRLLSAGQG